MANTVLISASRPPSGSDTTILSAFCRASASDSRKEKADCVTQTASPLPARKGPRYSCSACPGVGISSARFPNRARSITVL